MLIGRILTLTAGLAAGLAAAFSLGAGGMAGFVGGGAAILAVVLALSAFFVLDGAARRALEAEEEPPFVAVRPEVVREASLRAVVGELAGSIAAVLESQSSAALELVRVASSAEPALLVAAARSLALASKESGKASAGHMTKIIADGKLRLGFARAIIKSVPDKTEEAAFSLLSRFEDLRGNASKAAGIARQAKESLAGGSGRRSMTQIAEETRSAVRAERSAVGVMASHNRKNTKELRAMGQEIEGGIDLLNGIEEITERSRLIAFNMAVEAARIGEKGRGFRVIVGELRSLNDRTAEFSRRVSDLLGRFRTLNETIVAEMAEGSERVIEEVERGMDAAEKTVESLIETADQTAGIARDIASMAEGVDHGLDGVLESLQFQDITRQMIEGGILLLDEVRAGIERTVEETSREPLVSAEVHARMEAIRREIIARSKTKGEKEAVLEVKA